MRSGVRERVVPLDDVIAHVGRTLIRSPAGPSDERVADALSTVCEAAGTERASLTWVDGAGAVRTVHGGEPPGRRESGRGSDGDVPWPTARTRERHPVWWASLDELEANDPDRRRAESEGVRSLCALPLVSRGEWIGAVVLTTYSKDRAWPPWLRRRLGLLANHFALALALEPGRAEAHRRRSLERAIRPKEVLEKERRCLAEALRPERELEGIIGRSPGLRKALVLAEKVASTEALVLLQGETGTGKELFANLIHSASPRCGRPMVRVNCASLPPTLIESELFGHERGAYTGAVTREPGRFEKADGSTLLLDEIGELPLELQGKLLRILEQGQFERLGSSRTLTVDVRVVASTNRDLSALVSQGKFRQDLFFRLNVFSITVPPLRDRPDDIPLLVWRFVDRLGRGMGRRIESIRPEALARLQAHAWPGNVRELKNTIERALILSTGPVLDVEIPRGPQPEDLAPRSLRDVEFQQIVRVLDHTGWKVRGRGGAAEILDLRPTTLESRMRRLGIQRPRLRSG